MHKNLILAIKILPIIMNKEVKIYREVEMIKYNV
jgi:hypothetical protein